MPLSDLIPLWIPVKKKEKSKPDPYGYWDGVWDISEAEDLLCYCCYYHHGHHCCEHSIPYPEPD